MPGTPTADTQYEPVPGWAKVPHGYFFREATSVAVDGDDLAVGQDQIGLLGRSSGISRRQQECRDAYRFQKRFHGFPP